MLSQVQIDELLQVLHEARFDGGLQVNFSVPPFLQNPIDSITHSEFRTLLRKIPSDDKFSINSIIAYNLIGESKPSLIGIFFSNPPLNPIFHMTAFLQGYRACLQWQREEKNEEQQTRKTLPQPYILETGIKQPRGEINFGIIDPINVKVSVDLKDFFSKEATKSQFFDEKMELAMPKNRDDAKKIWHYIEGIFSLSNVNFWRSAWYDKLRPIVVGKDTSSRLLQSTIDTVFSICRRVGIPHESAISGNKSNKILADIIKIKKNADKVKPKKNGTMILSHFKMAKETVFLPEFPTTWVPILNENGDITDESSIQKRYFQLIALFFILKVWPDQNNTYKHGAHREISVDCNEENTMSDKKQKRWRITLSDTLVDKLNQPNEWLGAILDLYGAQTQIVGNTLSFYLWKEYFGDKTCFSEFWLTVFFNLYLMFKIAQINDPRLRPDEMQSLKAWIQLQQFARKRNQINVPTEHPPKKKKKTAHEEALSPITSPLPPIFDMGETLGDTFTELGRNDPDPQHALFATSVFA